MRAWIRLILASDLPVVQNVCKCFAIDKIQASRRNAVPRRESHFARWERDTRDIYNVNRLLFPLPRLRASSQFRSECVFAMPFLGLL